ncbi:MAG TPA: division/cell wall cluster transcriptional repressor MraZ [Planctomycetaceae bacterium]|nr:division/cell wall cluster transcriptional repressor MraZ [Planctomycetaceae bacterium]HIQ22089.1 division/cell wall cluster transcriptional repressor MraZ [Planctomycetota bacterium]
MAAPEQFILGEFRRRLDDRYRVAIPGELAERLAPPGQECILAKERSGCLSLWNAALWQSKLDQRVELIKQKLGLGDLDRRIGQLQLFGRLLSTRHASVQLDKQARVLVPKEFREFLGAEPGDEVVVVGAAVCVEIWNPPAWLGYIQRRMPRFRKLCNRLSQS